MASFSASNPTVSDHALRVQVQHRLIAVWALAEGFLGGILHGLHIPVTGLVIGSISVCCLALLSQVNRQRGQFLKATLLVMLVKAMLSPHSPPMAYFAVFCQGFLAELFFTGSKRYKLNCYLVAILSQLQSALQHLFVLVVVFGTEFWQAVDQYLNKLTASWGLSGISYALYFAAAYIGLHLLAGIFAGWLASQLPTWLRKQNSRPKTVGLEAQKVTPVLINPRSGKKKKRFNFLFLLIWLLLLAVFLQSYFGMGPAILPKAKALQIMIRSVLIVAVWYFIVSPFLLRYFKKWLQNQRGALQNQLQAILDLLPETQQLFRQSWQQSAHLKNIARLRFFMAHALPRLFVLPEDPR